MRRLPIWILLSLVFAIASPSGPAAADTGISFGLHIGDRYRGPDLGFYDEPNVVAVPGRVGVYYVQDSDQDLYRYGNTWYMNYNGDWYRASSYSGPFTFVGYRSVPEPVYTVPTSYRHWRDYRDAHYDWARSERYTNDYSNTGSITLRIGDRYNGPDLGFYREPRLRYTGYSGVYYVRGTRNDVYRYGNAWYMNYNGDWYRASSYNGPWIFVTYRSVPTAVYSVPGRYRRNWSDYRDRHYMWTSSGDRFRYGRSGVGISLRIGDRYRGPSLGFYDEPTMIRVPGTYVYYTQDSDNDVYRYGNYWYMNYNGDWYRAGSYNGPWVFVGYRSVPRDVYSVPTQYRRRWSDFRDQHYDWNSSSGYGDNVYYRSTATTSPSIMLRIGSRYNGPSIQFNGEPDVVAVPGVSGVYYVQDSDTDIYRYGNNWYMNYNGDWYRAASYDGPWIFVGYRSVPRNVYSVPPTYRRNWSDFRDRHYDWDDQE